MDNFTGVDVNPSRIKETVPLVSRQYAVKTAKRSLWRRIAGRIRRHCSELTGWIASDLVRPFSSRNGFLSSLYYLCFSPAFRREQQALLAGFEEYYEVCERPTEGSALLRRNVHMLEKGLLMRPRRDVFAVDYIGETVDCFSRTLVARGDYGLRVGSELQWAHDVLWRYFEVVGSHPVIDAAQQRFARIMNGYSGRPAGMMPYRRDLTGQPPVTVEDLLALACRRSSVRWFLNRPVPREMVDRAIEIARQSPSACNRQPFVFHVFDDPDLVQRASVISMGTAGYAQNIPVFVVVVGQQRNYFDERDRHLIYIDGAMATMGFVYALEAQGLGSCCINWPDIEEPERRMAELLKLKADERPVMCVAVGYPDPDGLVAYSQKKPLEHLRQYNFE